MSDNWRDEAACAHPYVDPTWFDTDERGTRPIRAMRICQGCPVRMDCFLEAIDTLASDDEGVWGGTTPRSRRMVRQGRMSVARAFANGDATAALRTDQEREDDVLQAHLAGLSPALIAKAVHIGLADVRVIIERAGVAA